MNLERAYKNLSKALTFKTVSSSDIKKIDKKSFSDFLSFIEEAYPLINSKLSKTIINDFSPVFFWKAEPKDSCDKSGISKKPYLLIAHYDVVPVMGDGWIHEPFSGYMDEKNIFGRGAIDNKNSVIAILEAVETLLENNYIPSRDFYIAFGFDEEIGGKSGAAKIAQYFKNQEIHFDIVLDEGGIITDGSTMGIDKDIAVIGLAEKGNTNIELIFTGDEGHSSMPPKNTSIGKMANFINIVEKNPRKPRIIEPVLSMLKAISPHKKGIENFILKYPLLFSPLIISSMNKKKQTYPMLRSTVAFTMTKSGNAPNVLPKKASCTANIRLLPGETANDIIEWLKSFGNDFEINPISLDEASSVSSKETLSYNTLKKCIHNIFGNIVITPYLMVGGTDSKHYQEVADNIYRFMPCKLSNNDLLGMHGTNEFISKRNFESMIKFYMNFVEEMDEN